LIKIHKAFSVHPEKSAKKAKWDRSRPRLRLLIDRLHSSRHLTFEGFEGIVIPNGRTASGRFRQAASRPEESAPPKASGRQFLLVSSLLEKLSPFSTLQETYTKNASVL